MLKTMIDYESFHTLNEIENWLLYSVAPDIRVKLESIGKSFEYRDIWSVSIGDPTHPKNRI